MDVYDPARFGFPEGSLVYDCAKDVRDEIVQASQRIRGAASFERFWNRVLTADERKKLGGDQSACFQQQYVANFLMDLRSFSLERSIIEIAFQLGFLTVQTFDWLLPEIGELPPRNLRENPVWNLATGKLEFRGQVVKQVRVAVATNVVLVLDGFQKFNWPSCIENPVESVNPQTIHQTVRSLNDGLSDLRFYALNDRICWETATSQ